MNASRLWRVGFLAGAVVTSTLAIGVGRHDARAQPIDPRRPSTFVVGAPAGAAPMHRVDGRRSGLTKALLPSGTLRIPWRKPTSLTVDQPALAGPDGLLAVVSTRGDVVFLDEGGEERGMVRVGASQVGPATITSDGTVVYTTSNGEAVGVRRTSTSPRFTTRIGGERNSRGAAPLSLDDGGVVVATMSDLVVLDAEGNVRARAALPEPAAAPLVAAGDKIVAVTTTGAVFGWTPGREPMRLGSFGAPIDGGAALADPTTLVAVIEGNQLAEVDLARGGRRTRGIAAPASSAAQVLWLGPPALRRADAGPGASPSGDKSLATMLALTTTRGYVVTVDGAGQELLRAPIASFTPTILADGGAAPLVAPSHVAPLVDVRGAIAYAATDGHVGVVSPDGAVDEIGEILCPRGLRSGVVGLTPFAAGSFAVTCDGGTVVRVTGSR